MPRLWIVLTRPDNLTEALAVASAIGGRFSECRLIHERSPWWQRAQWGEYRRTFADVIPCDKVPTCRGLIDLPRLHRELLGRQRRLASLSLAPDDLIICLAGITGLSHAVASAWPHLAKILCVTRKKYEDSSRRADFRRYRYTTAGWLQSRFVEPLVGLRRTLNLKPIRRQGGDGVRLQRPEAPLEEIYRAIVILSNSGRELPAGAGPSLFAAPFPGPADVAPLLGSPTAPGAGSAAARRKMVFFGTPYLLVRNLPPEQYAPILNRCLDFLRRHYGSRCDLVYRPHPAETRERDRLHLEGFVIEVDQEVAQLYFLQHFREIEAVYSVSSTVSRVALNYGLNGYALWRCFPFAPQAAAYFETLMGTVPAEFDICSLETAPQAYAERLAADAGRPRFASALAGAVDSLASAPEKPVAPRANPP